MKTLSAGMQTVVASRLHTLAWGMKVVRGGDADISGWTNHHKQKTVTVDASPLLLNPSNALDMSALSRSSGWDVDNLEATVLSLDDFMTREDIYAGLWDYSSFYIFEYDWATTANGIIPHIAGNFGVFKPKIDSFVVELRDLRQWLQQDATRITQANCDYDFGDSETCTVNLAPHTYSGTVSGVTDARMFTAVGLVNPTDDFTEGKVTWLTGLNAGRSHKVRTHTTGGVFTLALPMLSTIQVGDTFTAIRGCLKRRADCIAYTNILNFPGFDQKPTRDELTGGAVIA